MSEMTIAFLILGVTIALFVSGRLSSDLVALGSLLALYLTGLVDLGQAFAGFSNSTVILVGALFVVREGLTRTGVTACAGERLVAQARGKPVRRPPHPHRDDHQPHGARARQLPVQRLREGRRTAGRGLPRDLPGVDPVGLAVLGRPAS